MIDYKLLPFNFERLASGNVLISNMVGSFHLLDSESQLHDLISGNISTELVKKLESSLFIARGKIQQSTYADVLASGVASSIDRGLAKPSLFLLVPTLRCDHDCDYCQVSRKRVNDEGFDIDPDLLPEIAQKIINIGTEPYKIEFQGGEPLLRFDLIRRFYDELKKISPNVRYEIVIATTLSLINDEVLDWAKDKNVIFSTSVDGTEYIHNSSRKIVGTSSYALLKRGLLKIKESLGEGRVGAVTTLTKQAIQDPMDIIHAHIELELSEIFLRPLSPFGFATKNYATGYSVEEYKNYYSTLLTKLIENYETWRIKEAHALIMLEKIWTLGASNYVDLKSPAGYVLGALLFNYDGYIYGADEARMMFESHGVESLRLGYVTDPLDLSSNQISVAMLADSFIQLTPGCEECAYSPYCGSDLMHHLSTQADYVGDKSISTFCAYQKAGFEVIFQLLSNKETAAILKKWYLDEAD